MKRKFDPSPAVCGLAMGCCLGAFALDNTINNDYWNTTGYVNNPPTERVSGALDAAFETPLPVTFAEGEAGGAFDSRWFSCFGADLESVFHALRPGLHVIIR